MRQSKYARTVRFDPESLARLERISIEQGRSVADLIRLALERFLADETGVTASKRRHLRVAEYTQVALDAMIRENHPELRDQLVLETDRRMERYHGAR